MPVLPLDPRLREPGLQAAGWTNLAGGLSTRSLAMKLNLSRQAVGWTNLAGG